MAGEVVPARKRTKVLRYYGRGLLSVVETGWGRVSLVLAAVGVVASSVTLPLWVPIGASFLYVNVALLWGNWKENQQLHEHLKAISDSRPRIGVEVFHGPETEDFYSTTKFWGLRIHNEGAAATFNAKLQVTEDRSATRQYHHDEVALAWSEARDSEKELFTGDRCDLQFCMVQTMSFTMSSAQPDRLRVDGGTANSPRIVWESKAEVGETHDPYAVLAASIFSNPPMIGGALRLTLRLDKNGLRVLSELNSAELPRRESAS